MFTYAAELAHPPGTPKPCVLTTARGDQAATIEQLEQAFAGEEFEVARPRSVADRPGADGAIAAAQLPVADDD